MDYIAIIADDLTGASDTGVKLCKKGYKTKVALQIDSINSLIQGGEILAVNTGTREASPLEAYKKVYDVTCHLKDRGFKKIFKKIDSVMRGNIGTEMNAVMDAFNINLAFVAPAIPANGRYIIDGYLYVGEERKEKKYVPEILEKTINKKIETIVLKDIRAGSKKLLNKINRLKNDDTIIIFDTENDGDFAIIAEALRNFNEEFVLAGTSGIAALLPEIWRLDQEIYNKREKTVEGRHLFVAGSFHPSTALQLERLIQNYSCHIVIIDTNEVLKNPKEAIKTIEKLKHSAAVSNRPEAVIIAVDTLLKKDIIPNESNGEAITDFISQAVLAAIDTESFETLTITGGETACSVMNALGATGMYLDDEIVSGVPVGRLIGGTANGMTIVTKSGGFGESETFIEVIKYLNNKRKVVIGCAI